MTSLWNLSSSSKSAHRQLMCNVLNMALRLWRHHVSWRRLDRQTHLQLWCLINSWWKPGEIFWHANRVTTGKTFRGEKMLVQCRYIDFVSKRWVPDTRNANESCKSNSLKSPFIVHWWNMWDARQTKYWHGLPSLNLKGSIANIWCRWFKLRNDS